MKPSRPEKRSEQNEFWEENIGFNQCHKAHDPLIKWYEESIKDLVEVVSIYILKHGCYCKTCDDVKEVLAKYKGDNQ